MMPSVNKLRTLSVLCLAFFCILAAGSLESSIPSNEHSNSQTAAQTDSPAVLKDAHALDEKYRAELIVSCASGADDYLRSIAKYDYKWDDLGMFEPKFDSYLKQVHSAGVITGVSDHAKLQNGFGAFQHIKLFCDYDTQRKSVTQYRYR